MLECSCPTNRGNIPSDKRVEYHLPGAFIRSGNVVMRDASKIIIFHADCPVHGYTIVEEGTSLVTVN